MRHRSISLLSVVAATVLLGSTGLTTTAFAQGQGGPGGGRFGQGRFGQQAASVVNVPIDVLTAALKLTDDQKTKIGDIQKKLVTDRQALFSGGGGGDRETMRANMEKFRDQQTTASKDIEALLTDDQKKALPDLLKDVTALNGTGIPVETYTSLNLTADQKTKIADIAKKSQDDLQAKMQSAQQGGDFQALREAMQTSRKDAHDSAMKVLTDAQREIVEKYIKEHPQQPGGGFGGFGGGRRQGQ